jgi:hypothetical protein
MTSLEYLTNSEGKRTAVIIPIELWQQLLPSEDRSYEIVSEAIEDNCLNKAMDEVEKSPLCDRNEALSFLED